MGQKTSNRDLTSQQAHVPVVVDVIANHTVHPTAIALSAKPVSFPSFPVLNQHSPPPCVLATLGIQL